MISTDDFWDWFAENANNLKKHGPSSPLTKILDKYFLDLWPQLSWEIGPHDNGMNYLAFSPNLSADFVPLSQSIVQYAREVPGWMFLAYRPPKTWDYRLTISPNGNEYDFDASLWSFIPLMFPDNDKVDLVMTTRGISNIREEDLWTAAAIALESEIGEETLLNCVEEFSLSPTVEPSLAGRLRPFKDIKNFFRKEDQIGRN